MGGLGNMFRYTSVCLNANTVTVQPNVYSYTYYGDGNKFKIDHNDSIVYGVIEEDFIYKISQSEDSLWHKNADSNSLRDPKDQISVLISKLNAVIWSEYDSKTETLSCKLTDGKITAKLISNELTVNIEYTDGSEKSLNIIVKDVGTTNVDLPQNIIDDTI